MHAETSHARRATSLGQSNMLKPAGAWLPWLALPVACGFRPPPPPQLVLDGECAGVKSSESWKTKEGEPHWSYRIKVAPWTVFGRVHVELHGWGMQATVVRGGDLDVKAKSFWVTLHPKHAAGPDDTFQIEGVGEPFAEPALSCEGLQEADGSSAELCPLLPEFVIQSDMNEVRSGHFRAFVHVETWVLQTLVTIDFGESSITLGRDIYGARLTEGGDGTSSRAVLSMLPLKRCLGMYKDASCDNAFGFSAVAEPAMMQLPRISCLLTRSMPNPPPPKPPLPPPSPPPGFNIDPGKCTNGGHAHFIVAPHSIPSQAALQTWELNVHLNLWLIGMHVVIDFPSLRHAKHALHVSAVRPPDVAKLVAVTQHSAIVELLETAARDFQFEALGDVESLEVICDLSNVRPFPPPPPPYYEWDDPDRPDEGEPQQPPGDDDGIGGGGDTPYSYYDPSPNDDASLQSSSPPPRARMPRPPRSPPEPPSPPPARGGQGVSGLRIVLIGVLLVGMVALGLQQRPQEVAKLAKRLRGTPVGRRLLRSPVGRSLLLLEARYLGVATAADLDGDDEEGGTPRALPAPKPKPKKATRKANSEVEPLQTSAAAESMVNEAEDDDGEQRRKRGTLFVVHLGGDEGQLEGLLRLEAVHELKELQRLVSLECDRLGVDMQRGFRMTFQDADGVNATVSKSCSMERIRGASRLELTPKSSSQGGNGVKAPPARALRNDDIDAPPVERL